MQSRSQNDRGRLFPGRFSLPSRALLPLRAFLGLTFCYAGWQKFTDPQFFDPLAQGYIGRQLADEAQHSPLSWLLTGLAIPHASFFGGLIAFGELLVGLATLLGLLSRLSASMGLLINVLLWLTVTWGVQPYFLGADTIYAIAWLTLVIAGAIHYSLDHWLAREQQQDHVALRRARRQMLPHGGLQHRRTTTSDAAAPERYRLNPRRRALLRLLLAGGTVGVTSVFTAFFARVVASLGRLSTEGADVNSGGPVLTRTAAPGTAVAIGTTRQILVNGTLPFTLRNGDSGIVIRLAATQYVAYDAACTHAGCIVQYHPSSKDLLCPCHGAIFDPANHGAVLSGLTNQPLASVPLRIDSAGNIFANE
jgi:thiosulfate dehydrogenase (quinone) large subunit